MDERDRKLLYELSKNSRIPGNILAKKLRLSKSSVAYRLNNLFKEKIILGTQTIIDNSRLGYRGYRIYFNFLSTTSKEEEDILNWLKKQEAVSVLATCSGNTDVAIMSWVKNDNDFEDLLLEIKKRYRSKITNLDIFVYTKTYHFNRNYLAKEKDKTILLTGKGGSEKYDPLDLKILNLLAEDSRISIVDLSANLNEPERTIAFRIKKLEEKKIIAGYSINLNLSKIGYEYFKLNIIFDKNTNEKDLIDFANSLDNSIYVDKTLGRFDFELNLEVQNREELDKIIREIKDKFDGIREISLFQIKEYLKIKYF